MVTKRNQQKPKDTPATRGPATEVINPIHYKHNGMETVDVMEAFFTSGKECDMHLSQAFKYISRAGDKIIDDEHPRIAYRRDIEKALWWLKRASQYLER